MRLKDIGTIVTGNTPSKKNNEYYESNDILFIKPSDIEENYITSLDNSEEYISEKARKTARILPEGAVLVTCIGTIGKVGILKKEASCNQQINAIIPNDKVISKYLAYLIQSKQKILQSKANAPVVPIINKTAFSEIEINICDKDNQEKIVKQLDLLKAIIDKRKEQIEELQNIIKSQFVEMFGNVNDNKNSYEIKTLNEVFEFIKDGTHSTPTYTNDKINGVKFLSAKDVTKGTINWENIKYIPLELHEQLVKRVKPQKGDILLAKNGTTGVCAKVDRDEIFDIYVSLALLRPKEGYVVDYLVQAINNDMTKEQFDRSLKGVGVPNLHLGEIQKVKIIVPPIKLQNQFAEIVKQIDKQKFEIENSLKEMQGLYESLMEKYFG